MCERALGSGAAMVIEALSLCFHLACFQVRGHERVKVRSHLLQSLQIFTLVHLSESVFYFSLAGQTSLLFNSLL